VAVHDPDRGFGSRHVTRPGECRFISGTSSSGSGGEGTTTVLAMLATVERKEGGEPNGTERPRERGYYELTG